jgi:hypothetical protein
VGLSLMLKTCYLLCLLVVTSVFQICDLEFPEAQEKICVQQMKWTCPITLFQSDWIS